MRCFFLLKERTADLCLLLSSVKKAFCWHIHEYSPISVVKRYPSPVSCPIGPCPEASVTLVLVSLPWLLSPPPLPSPFSATPPPFPLLPSPPLMLSFPLLPSYIVSGLPPHTGALTGNPILLMPVLPTVCSGHGGGRFSNFLQVFSIQCFSILSATAEPLCSSFLFVICLYMLRSSFLQDNPFTFLRQSFQLCLLSQFLPRLTRW